MYDFSNRKISAQFPFRDADDRSMILTRDKFKIIKISSLNMISFLEKLEIQVSRIEDSWVFNFKIRKIINLGAQNQILFLRSTSR